jgi:hypothetical protein
MFDNIKIMSEGLNASFKVTIYLPDDYDKNDKTYKSLYIVGGSNPFLIPTYSLEEILKQKNVIGISIYPNLEIKKNNLLFNSFDDKFGFSAIYESFIINEVKPLICQKYRVEANAKNNAIFGYKETAILAYSLAYHYTNEFEAIYMHELNIEPFKNHFMSDLMSRFDPNIGFYFSMQSPEASKLIEERLQMFGACSYKWYSNNLTSLLETL